jgi:dynein heavy chain
LQPKDVLDEKAAAEVKSANEITAEIIKYLMEDVNLKSLIFNLDEIKNKIDADSKGPYQNVFF